MDTPLIIDEKDPKWTLLGKILATVTSRRVKQEMAKHGIAPVNMASVMLKVVNLFRYHISCIVYHAFLVTIQLRQMIQQIVSVINGEAFLVVDEVELDSMKIEKSNCMF